MKKICQRKLEVSTTRTDAINKLIQLQGVCKGIKNSNDCLIDFYCHKNGKIVIENQMDRYSPKKAKVLTKLQGTVIEQDNKTYISYYTSLNKMSILARLSIFLIAILVLFVFFFITNFWVSKFTALACIIICVVDLIFQLISIEKERKSSSNISDILIKILEKKVDIINNWDK